MRKEEREKTYPVPDNFMDTGRILNGMFSTRCFFEGLAAAVPVLLIILSSPLPQEYRLPVAVFLSGAVFLLFNRNDGQLSPGQKTAHLLSFLFSPRRYEYDPGAGAGAGVAEYMPGGIRIYLDMLAKEVMDMKGKREMRTRTAFTNRRSKDEES